MSRGGIKREEAARGKEGSGTREGIRYPFDDLSGFEPVTDRAAVVQKSVAITRSKMNE